MEIDEWTFIQHRVSMNNQRLIIIFHKNIDNLQKGVLINF